MLQNLSRRLQVLACFQEVLLTGRRLLPVTPSRAHPSDSDCSNSNCCLDQTFSILRKPAACKHTFKRILSAACFSSRFPFEPCGKISTNLRCSSIRNAFAYIVMCPETTILEAPYTANSRSTRIGKEVEISERVKDSQQFSTSQKISVCCCFPFALARHGPVKLLCLCFCSCEYCELAGNLWTKLSRERAVRASTARLRLCATKLKAMF